MLLSSVCRQIQSVAAVENIHNEGFQNISSHLWKWNVPLNMSHKLTSKYLKDETQEFDLETIFILLLNNRGIYDLGCIGECVNLVVLDLSKNKLSSVMSLRKLTRLEILNISSNRLGALSGLENLESLSSLDVSGNFLNSVDCLLPLTKLVKLGMLVLKDDEKDSTNPMYSGFTDDVASKVMELLPNLQILNGEPQKGDGKAIKEMCEKMNKLSKQQESVDLHLNAWYADTVEEPSFVRIGFEENECYEKAKAAASACEKRSIEAHELLEKMRASIFDT